MVNNKKAFTLAEVLITLGIIGVVAAMTLPTLVNNAKNKELHSSLVKAYAAIQNAVQQMHAEDGTVIPASNYAGMQLLPKLEPYFNVAQNCHDKSYSNCIKIDELANIYKTHSNAKPIAVTQMDDGQFFTQDGMFYMLENPIGSHTILISVDVNGPYKNPNRWGYDLFTFQLMDDGKVLPVGAAGTSRNSYCAKTGTDALNGIGCTFKALYDKDYWKNL